MAERQYGNPDIIDDDVGNHDIVLKQTFYEGNEEELEYEDDPPDDEDCMVTQGSDGEADDARVTEEVDEPAEVDKEE